MSDRIIYGTGQNVRVDDMPDRLGDALAYATKAREHLWITTVVHRAGEHMLDQLDGRPETEDGPALLDVESMLAMPMTGCYVCESPYEPRLRRRRCPGSPDGSVLR